MAYTHARAVLLIALSLLLLPAAMAATSSAPAAFPLSAGVVWTYRGLVKWTNSANTISQKTLTWTMTITRTISYRQYVIAVLKGHPLDLAWYDETTRPGNYLIVYDGTAKYYLLDNSSIAPVMARVQAAKEDLADLLSNYELFLDLPLSSGKTFGADPQLPARDDQMYCWAVEQVQTGPLTGIASIDPKPTHTRYQLAYRTNPDEQVIDFVPTIGLTAFTYVHHGTVAEAHLKLVSLHLP